jgi:FkbM family methyltransferase
VSYTNIVTIHAAFWDQVGEIHVLKSTSKWGVRVSVLPSPQSPPKKHSNNNIFSNLENIDHPVCAITIDKLMREYNLPFFDILKSIIEGSEQEAFNNALFWIKKVKSIIIELHDMYRPGCSDNFYNNLQYFDTMLQQGENFMWREILISLK